jgi:hypothetical protein
MGISFLHPVTVSQKQVDAGLSAITQPQSQPFTRHPSFCRKSPAQSPAKSLSQQASPLPSPSWPRTPKRRVTSISRPLLVPQPNPINLLSQYILPQTGPEMPRVRRQAFKRALATAHSKACLAPLQRVPGYKCLKQLLASIVSYTAHSNRREKVKLGKRDKQDCVF